MSHPQKYLCSIPVCSDLDLKVTSTGRILSSDELPDLVPPCKKSANKIPSDPSDAEATTTGGDYTESGATSFVFRPTTPPKKIFVDSSSPTLHKDYHPDL